MHRGRGPRSASFRSTIGPNGFGKRREGDHRSPSGVYRIRVTFSAGADAPGAMPWKQRRPTSNVTNRAGRLYNTWIEEPWRTNGARASMRWGFIVNYNRPRLQPGVGPKPVAGKGSGIFYHTSLNTRSPLGTDGRLHPARQPQADALRAAVARPRRQATRGSGALTADQPAELDRSATATSMARWNVGYA